MRDGNGVHTIRDSCYHKETGCREDVGGGGVIANTSMVR